MKKQQQWWLLFKVFSSSKTTLTPTLINSSSYSSSTSSYIARPFCSLATTTNTSCLFAGVKKNLPLLIVPYNDDDQKNGIDDGGGSSVYDDTLGFISLFDDDDDDDDDDEINKKKALVHKMYLPEIADRRICGSSEGWLITIHENTEVQLLNPFSKVLVNLPPLLTSFPEVVVGKVEKENNKGGGGGGLCYLVHEHMRGVFEQEDSFSNSRSLKGYDSHFFRDHFFKKVVTSTTKDATTVVMAIYGEFTKLAFCRPSGNDGEQTKWMVCLHGDRLYFDDVTFYKGNFYAVGFFGDVVVVKGLDHGPSVVPFVETITERGEEIYSAKNYLVESSSSSSSSSLGGGGGDLLKVMRDVVYYEDRPYRTTRFRVFKVDFNNGGPASLVEVPNLGEDCALFIGYNHSFSFSASKIPGCRGNCIYFTDNNLEPFDGNNPYGGHDMGVYNLENGRIERPFSYPDLVMPPPIWYVPN